MYWQVRVDYWVFRLECPFSGLSHFEMINKVILRFFRNFLWKMYDTHFPCLLYYSNILFQHNGNLSCPVPYVGGRRVWQHNEGNYCRFTHVSCLLQVPNNYIADVRRHASWQYDANNTDTQVPIAQEQTVVISANTLFVTIFWSFLCFSSKCFINDINVPAGVQPTIYTIVGIWNEK